MWLVFVRGLCVVELHGGIKVGMKWRSYIAGGLTVTVICTTHCNLDDQLHISPDSLSEYVVGSMRSAGWCACGAVASN